MRRSTFIIASLVGAALFLSACDFSVVPVRQPDVIMGTGSSADARPLTVPARSDLLVRIDLSQAARGADLLYIELDQEMELEVWDSGRRLIASSASSAFFGPSRTGITSAALAPQGIGTTVTCRGSCVILEPSAARGSSVYAVIANPGSARSVELYAFADAYVDLNEPNNDSPAGAARITELGDDSGAIETIGDRDYWRVEIVSDLYFDVPPSSVLDLELWIEDPAGGAPFGPVPPGGQPIRTIPGDLIWIESRTNRAAASAESVYFLDFVAP